MNSLCNGRTGIFTGSRKRMKQFQPQKYFNGLTISEIKKITTRVRSMTEGNFFSLSVCPPCLGGVGVNNPTQACTQVGARGQDSGYSPPDRTEGRHDRGYPPPMDTEIVGDLLTWLNLNFFVRFYYH